MWPWNLVDDLEKQQGTSFRLHQVFCIISKPSVNWNWSYSLETLNSCQNWRFFAPCDLEIWWMTLKNNRVPILYCVKLCASFQSHQWIQTGVTVGKRPIGVKMSIFCPMWPRKLTDDLKNNRSHLLYYAGQALRITSKPSVNSNWSYSPETTNSGQNQRFFLSQVTLKFDGCPWKTTGHLFYATSSSVHHFIVICEYVLLKMELQSGNAQFGSKSMIFFYMGADRSTNVFQWPDLKIGHMDISSSKDLESRRQAVYRIKLSNGTILLIGL